MALEALGVDARRAVFVGDSLRCDIAGAEAVGLSPIPGAPAESGWSRWLIPAAPGAKSLQGGYGESFVKYFLLKSDPALDPTKFDYAKDIAKYADARTLLNATNPDLSGLRSRGAKLLMYFGWADTALPPVMGI